jgi:N-acetylglutamate synthase-like GNAT family acetyltransferase
VLLEADVAEMKRLFVDPALRGHGAGSALVRTIEESAVLKV